MTPRCELVFFESIKSQATKKTYQDGINSFLKTVKLNDISEILTMSNHQSSVENYVIYMKNRISRNSLKAYLSGIKLFLEMNDISLNWTKIRKLLPQIEKNSGSKAYTNDDVREWLSCSANKQHIAIVHVLASSGMRIGSLADLKLKHLEDMKHGCKSVLVYADDREEYTTFISHEAVKALDDYFEERKKNGETLTPDSYLFVKLNGQKYDDISIRVRLLYQSKKLKCRTLDKNHRTDKMMNHAFRKRFNTILKLNSNVNISLAERMMGHSVTVSLDNAYFDPSKEQLFDEYLKALPELVLDEKFKLENENLDLQQKNEELELKNKEVEQLKDQMREIQAHIMNIQSKES